MWIISHITSRLLSLTKVHILTTPWITCHPLLLLSFFVQVFSFTFLFLLFFTFCVLTHFQGEFNQPLDHLPSSLTFLELESNAYDQPLLHLPSNLTHLFLSCPELNCVCRKRRGYREGNRKGKGRGYREERKRGNVTVTHTIYHFH